MLSVSYKKFKVKISFAFLVIIFIVLPVENEKALQTIAIYQSEPTPETNSSSIIFDSVELLKMIACIENKTNCVCYDHKAQRLAIVIENFPATVKFWWINSKSTLNHILTLTSNEFDLDFMEIIEEFKVNLEKAGECVRSTASLPHDDLS